MLRSVMTAVAAATASSKARTMAREAAFGMIGVSALIIALVFLAIAAYYFLIDPLGTAGAAAAVSAFLAIFAVIIFIWAFYQQRNDKNGLLQQFGLPSVDGLNDIEDVEQLVKQTQASLRKVGPVKLSVAALAIGFLAARMK